MFSKLTKIWWENFGGEGSGSKISENDNNKNTSYIIKIIIF